MSFTVRFSAVKGVKLAKKLENSPTRGGDFRHRDPLAIVEHFEDLPDPRSDRDKEHRLIDIIVHSLCCVLGGCEAFTETGAKCRSAKLNFRAPDFALSLA